MSHTTRVATHPITNEVIAMCKDCDWHGEFYSPDDYSQMELGAEIRADIEDHENATDETVDELLAELDIDCNCDAPYGHDCSCPNNPDYARILELSADYEDYDTDSFDRDLDYTDEVKASIAYAAANNEDNLQDIQDRDADNQLAAISLENAYTITTKKLQGQIVGWTISNDETSRTYLGVDMETAIAKFERVIF